MPKFKWNSYHMQQRLRQQREYIEETRRRGDIVRQREKSRTKPAYPKRPYYNPDWRNLKVHDSVTSLIDPELRDRLIRIKGTDCWLQNTPGKFALSSLQKIDF